MEREKEQMMREKEELMLRLQDYEQKTKKAEKGGPALSHGRPPHRRGGGAPAPLGVSTRCGSQRETGLSGCWGWRWFPTSLLSVLNALWALSVKHSLSPGGEY